jgi:hypothetical protein
MPRISVLASAGTGCGTGRDRITHEKAALPACFDESLRQQLVVGRDHRVRAHALLPRAFAHRRKPRSGRQQARADALGKAAGQLLRQRLGGGSCQHARVLCVDDLTDTGSSHVRQTVSVL